MGSAIAFRLFLFFVPLLLLVAGIAGFASGFVNARAASKTAGTYGRLGAEISEPFHQPGFTRWFAVLFGLFGVLTAGRSLSRVLHVASAVAWRLPLSGSRASLRTAGVVAGLICSPSVRQPPAGPAPTAPGPAGPAPSARKQSLSGQILRRIWAALSSRGGT